MAIKTTRWSPDTCACVIEYTWDSDMPHDKRVHTFSKLVQRCSDHVELPNDTDVWDAVVDENPRKNNALRICLQNGPATLFNTRQSDGERLLKEDIEFRWRWAGKSPNRVLNISFSDSINSKISIVGKFKTDIESALTNTFGTGKTVLE